MWINWFLKKKLRNGFQKFCFMKTSFILIFVSLFLSVYSQDIIYFNGHVDANIKQTIDVNLKIDNTDRIRLEQQEYLKKTYEELDYIKRTLSATLAIGLRNGQHYKLTKKEWLQVYDMKNDGVVVKFNKNNIWGFPKNNPFSNGITFSECYCEAQDGYLNCYDDFVKYILVPNEAENFKVIIDINNGKLYIYRNPQRGQFTSLSVFDLGSVSTDPEILSQIKRG